MIYTRLKNATDISWHFFSPVSTGITPPAPSSGLPIETGPYTGGMQGDIGHFAPDCIQGLSILDSYGVGSRDYAPD